MRETVNVRKRCNKRLLIYFREDIMDIRRIVSHLMLMPLALGLGAAAQAEDASAYPNRPIKVIVPVGPGAGLDNAARISAEAVEKHLGQRLVLENKPGAGQRIATAFVAKSPPDGYTLLFTTPTPIAIAEHFYKKLDYDPARDLAPVAIAVYQPVLLIVRPTLGVRTVPELIARAKADAGKISFGVQGLGGEMHLMLEVLKKQAGINVTAVPYNAAAQAITDLLGDRLDAMFLVIAPIKGHVETGRLLALATLNARRVAQFPDLPTMDELGLPAMTAAIWFGYLAPAKTPKAVIDKLARAFGQLQSDSALAMRIADMGAELIIVGPTDFAKTIDDDRRRYGSIVAESNLDKLN
jgi:tripartite-type tricarboxylate transporter receptor subunit TctC